MLLFINIAIVTGILTVSVYPVGAAVETPSQEELAKLDPYAERYNVERVIREIQSRPYDPDQGFSFVAWGDVRSNPEVFERLWAAIQKEDAVFSICTGDLVQRGYVDQWLNDFFSIVDQYHTVPFLPVYGNHDVGFSGIEYMRIFGVRDYYFDYGDSRLIGVDNVNGLTPQQLAWIENLLKSAEGKKTFVFAHKPPETIEKWAYHAFDDGADEFCELMTQYKVDTVFLGHIHAYSTAKHEGIDYVITGGGGAGLHSRYGPMGNIHHYCVVNVKGGNVSHDVVRLMDDQLVRSPGGNEFYQLPEDLISDTILAAVRTIVPVGEIKDVEIEGKNGQTLYTVELKERVRNLGTRDVDIIVTEDGTILEIEWELFEQQLPERISIYLKENYTDETFDEAKKIQENGQIVIEVTLVRSDGTERDVVFDEKGNFIEEDD